MKYTFMVAALLAAFISQPAAAQTATAGAAAGASSSSEASSGSLASSNNSIVFGSAPSDITNRVITSGESTVKTAPAVQPPSMGSGHPCGLSGSIGISVIGGGAGAGMNKVDEACLLAQMGQGEAALIMIAGRDESACKALRQVGRIAANSLCTAQERREAARKKPAAVSSNSGAASVAYNRCEKQEGNRVVFSTRSGQDSATAKAQCLSALGY